jgi:hypothetical protein
MRLLPLSWMKTRRWFLMSSIVVWSLGYPGQAAADPIKVSFDDLTDQIVLTSTGLKGFEITTPETNKLAVRIPDVLTTVAPTNTSRSFALLEPVSGDSPAGIISDILTFRTFTNSKDYELEFSSDFTEAGLTGGPFYGTKTENGTFQEIPLPKDAPVPPNFTVVVRSDAPTVPEPSSLMLLGMGCAMLKRFVRRSIRPIG